MWRCLQYSSYTLWSEDVHSCRSVNFIKIECLSRIFHQFKYHRSFVSILKGISILHLNFLPTWNDDILWKFALILFQICVHQIIASHFVSHQQTAIDLLIDWYSLYYYLTLRVYFLSVDPFSTVITVVYFNPIAEWITTAHSIFEGFQSRFVFQRVLWSGYYSFKLYYSFLLLRFYLKEIREIIVSKRVSNNNL